MPKSKFDSKAESSIFELLPDGDYPFEVTGCDFSLSTGGKTHGSDMMELKLTFFRNNTFSEKCGKCHETLIFHPNSEWKLSVFAKCANVLVNGQVPGDGVEIEWTAGLVLGLRGWATVRSKEGTKDKTKKFNYVASFLTNKEKLARAFPEPVQEPEPF